MSHDLHKLIGGTVLKEVPGGVLLDEACGGGQQLPLFCSLNKGRDTQFCKVDLLVLQNNKVRVVMEIEESNIKPTQIGGKFITTALSSHFCHDRLEKSCAMAESVLFIQVVDGSKLKKQSQKPNQFKKLGIQIQNVIPLKNSSVKEYRLFIWSKRESKKVLSDIVKAIKNALRMV